VTGARNVRGGLVLLSLGLVGGLAMSLYAFTPLVSVPAGLAQYDDLPRRLIRLAHIAAVMLPLINIVLAPWIDRVALPPVLRDTASWLLLTGAAGLPVSLVLEAVVPVLRPLHLPGIPAAAVTVAVCLIARGACRGIVETEEADADDIGRGVDDTADRGDALQEGSAHA
jgi:hypothetical protein